MATYQINIGERTKEEKVFKEKRAIKDYKEKTENDYLVQKTKEALESPDYKILELNEKVSDYLKKIR